jgi:hypothetical protein
MMIRRRRLVRDDDFRESIPASPARYQSEVVPVVNPAVQVIYFLAGVVEVILGLRLLFRLLAASPANALVGFIYNLSAALVRPFSGTVNVSLGIASFETVTLVAMLVYALLAALLVAAIRALSGRF